MFGRHWIKCIKTTRTNTRWLSSNTDQCDHQANVAVLQEMVAESMRWQESCSSQPELGKCVEAKTEVSVVKIFILHVISKLMLNSICSWA